MPNLAEITTEKKASKVLSKSRAHKTAIRSTLHYCSPQPDINQVVLQDNWYEISVSHDMPVILIFHWYSLCFPLRVGQAELTLLANYIPRWFTSYMQMVLNPRTNRAPCGATYQDYCTATKPICWLKSVKEQKLMKCNNNETANTRHLSNNKSVWPEWPMQ